MSSGKTSCLDAHNAAHNLVQKLSHFAAKWSRCRAVEWWRLTQRNRGGGRDQHIRRRETRLRKCCKQRRSL